MGTLKRSKTAHLPVIIVILFPSTGCGQYQQGFTQSQSISINDMLLRRHLLMKWWCVQLSTPIKC